MLTLLLLSFLALPDRVVVDGMECHPNIPLLDPRPFGPMTVDVHTGDDLTVITIEPVALAISVTFDGSTYEWRFSGSLRPGDFDRDDDVDQSDFGHLQACFTERWTRPTAGCWDADLNRDASVDAEDVAVFQQSMRGSR